MRLFSTLLWIVAFVALLVFSISNTHSTEMRLVGSTLSLSAPLVIFLLGFFVLGVVFGLLTAVPSWFRGRREIARLKKELAALQQGVQPARAPLPDVPTGTGPVIQVGPLGPAA